MIINHFMEECENCPHLEVIANSMELFCWETHPNYDHTITCKHLEKCESIKNHLKEEMKKNGN